jgi:phenylalanyl-tRNA synthetase beta chain
LKFSYEWMRDMVPGLAIPPAELEHLITMKTAECEGIERWGEHFEHIVAVRVLSVDPLGKGKNKRVVIDAGDGKQHTVVCGAPNVAPGIVAAWARPGTRLGERTIGRIAIEELESEGMLASGEELGINRDHSGVLTVAADAGGKLPGLAPDWIIEIDNKSLTHRPDLWGHYGMAREVAAIGGHRLVDPVSLRYLPEDSGQPVNVIIDDYQLCPRYSALVFESAKVEPSPLWLQARLQSIGINPINNIVDVTNYVLAELPQPMHAFDGDKLAGDTIFVRRARAGETLKALNDLEYNLTTEDLVIADASGAIAIAGVIGGADTAISDTTTRIVLESANFNAAAVRLTSSRHKLRTDASMRFEKSLDPTNTVRGLARAAQLLLDICPSIRVVGGVVDSGATLPALPVIELPVDFVARRLGKQLGEAEIVSILEALGFGVEPHGDAGLRVSVPSWRATKDISSKHDLLEEVGRLIGYGEITPTAPLLPAVVPPEFPMRRYLRQVRSALVSQGLTEVYNYSFVNEAQVKRFGETVASYLEVANPIASELTHMRRSLLPGVFDTVARNARHLRDFRFFEIGHEIHAVSGNSLPAEIAHAVAVIYGLHADEREFFELKRTAECLFPNMRLVPAEAKQYEHPARVAEIEWRGEIIGRLFEIHPLLLKNEGIEGRATVFDVDLDKAQPLAESSPVYKPLRKYPTSGFDLSVVTSLRHPVAAIHDALAESAGDELVSIEFVRQYAGAPLEEGQKSVSFHMEVGAPDHTLTTEEAAAIRNRIIDGMRAEGYDLRM